MQRGYRSYRIASIHLNPLVGRNLDIVLIVLYLFATITKGNYIYTSLLKAVLIKIMSATKDILLHILT